jgi:hypothetical protein
LNAHKTTYYIVIWDMDHQQRTESAKIVNSRGAELSNTFQMYVFPIKSVRSAWTRTQIKVVGVMYVDNRIMFLLGILLEMTFVDGFFPNT